MAISFCLLYLSRSQMIMGERNVGTTYDYVSHKLKKYYKVQV